MRSEWDENESRCRVSMDRGDRLSYQGASSFRAVAPRVPHPTKEPEDEQSARNSRSSAIEEYPAVRLD